MGENMYAQQRRHHRSEAHSEYFASTNYGGTEDYTHDRISHSHYSNQASRSRMAISREAEETQIQPMEQHYQGGAAYREVNCSSPASTTSSKFSWISNSQYFSRTSSSVNQLDEQEMLYDEDGDYPNHNQEHLNNVHMYGSVEDVPAGFMQYSGDSQQQQSQRQQMLYESSFRYSPSIAAESHPSNASMASVRSSPRSSKKSPRISPKTAKRKRMINLRRSFDPTFVNIDDDFNSSDYPTFVCPRCRTRQREFISKGRFR